MEQRKSKKGKLFLFIIIGVILFGIINDIIDEDADIEEYTYSDKIFKIISSSENKILDSSIKEYARKKGYSVVINYADTLEIIDIGRNIDEFIAFFHNTRKILSSRKTVRKTGKNICQSIFHKSFFKQIRPSAIDENQNHSY